MHHPDIPKQALRNANNIIWRIGRVPLLLVILWAFTVWWGEHAVFTSCAKACTWNNWETWGTSSPHHVLLVADPQIVDPHTYPDRPWPLSSLTILYTDLYLKRSYRNLLSQLHPDSTIFLGDLFDGGREWGTKKYSSPDPKYKNVYKQYKQDFWLREYVRFQDMFVKTWNDAGMASLPSNGGRRLITSLPGNHDLGFAGGINPHVKSRFDGHFGPLNRIDVLGNHTFVSLDTVSLSAMDQVDPETGSSGQGDGTAAATKSSKIWKPVEAYLNEARTIRERAVKQEIRNLGARSPFPELRQQSSRYPAKFPATVETPSDPSQPTIKHQPDPLEVSTSQFPTIILTHVPLHRSDTQNCGPNRERGSHIPISWGYQYQNVLTPLISKDIIDHLDASQIAMVYSGDDHDYCEVEHDEFTGRIREITVKSMSWAMGIRTPGVQLVSLWNPVDLQSAVVSHAHRAEKEPSEENLSMPRGTVQNHLCLLPDQLGIFVTYAELLALTLIALLIRALLWRPSSTTSPYTRPDLEKDLPLAPLERPTSSNDSSSSSTLSVSGTPAIITSRKTLQPSYGYGNIPVASRSRSHSPSKEKLLFLADSDDWGNATTNHDRKVYAHAHHDASRLSGFERLRWRMDRLWLFRRSRTKVEEFARSVISVGMPVLVLYVWLMWTDF